MVDLTPNFAPELYSQGVGTGSAQVFDLGAPNPFEVAKQNQEQTLANQQELNKKLIDYETKKQEKLDGFLEKYSDMTSEWGKTQTTLGKEVNKYGDLISGMRAMNKSVDTEAVMAAQKSLKELAKQNEENYKKYSKIGTEMTDINIYSDEERAAFEAEIDAANEKENPIQEIQKVVDTWQKSLATPDIVALYKKQKPEAKDKTGYLTATTEEDAKQVVDNIWANMKPIEKKKTLDRYVKEGKIDQALALKLTDANGVYDLNNPDIEAKVSQLMFDEVKPQMEYDVTPKPVVSSGGGNSSEFDPNVPTIESTRYYETTPANGKDTYVLNIPKQAQMNLTDSRGVTTAVQSGSVIVNPLGKNNFGLTPGVYIQAKIDPTAFPVFSFNSQKDAEVKAKQLSNQYGGAEFNVIQGNNGKYSVKVNETNNTARFPLHAKNNAVVKAATKTKSNKYQGFDVRETWASDNDITWDKPEANTWGGGSSKGKGNQQTTTVKGGKAR